MGVGADFTPCTPSVSFSVATTALTEFVNATACHAGKTINIPIKIAGPVLTGGNATATATVVGGNAVSGADYLLSTNAVTFNAGVANTTLNVAMTVYDNGSATIDKSIVLKLSVAANGSNAILANVLDTATIVLQNDDKAPVVGGVETHTTVSASTVGNNLSSPFPGASRAARVQYILSPQELTDAGVRPNTPITGLAFKVLNKFSTAPFSSYNVRMGNTIQTSFTSSFANAPTLVYTASLSTTVGWNNLTFSNNFTWDGVSGVVVEICFTGTSSIGVNNDVTEGYYGNGAGMAYNNTTSSASGCSLSFNSALINTAKPKMRFTQQVAPTPVETLVSNSRSWKVLPGDSVYFYATSDSALIAAIISPADSIGCIPAQVTHAGAGFIPVAYGWGNRSVKEFKLLPDAGNATTNYNAIFYLKNTELSGVSLVSPGILQTTTTADAAINSSNSVVVPATVINGTDYTGFKGNFNKFGRFFILDRSNPLAVTGNITTAQESIIVINPIKDQLIISYNLDKSTGASLKLYDVAGRLVYQGSLALETGNHTTNIDIAGLSLASGQYFLQLITPQKIYNQKLTAL